MRSNAGPVKGGQGGLVSGEATGEDLLNQKRLCQIRLMVSDFTI